MADQKAMELQKAAARAVDTMINGYQSTLRCAVKFRGTGLHSGRQVNLELLPAQADSGVIFQRVDRPNARPVTAHPYNISATDLSTTIGTGRDQIGTIEHLMAALAGLGIDNVLVRIDGPEVPILDGSAAPFVDHILVAGIAKVKAPRKMLVVKKPFELSDGDRSIRIEPAQGLTYRCNIDYPTPVIGRQSIEFNFSRSAFLRLCGARTFCHVREVEAMRKAGLALGGSLANAVVVSDEAVLNEEGLRSGDEFVRHKLLDCIGDLALLGAPLVGRVLLNRPGHSLHARFMAKLLAKKADVLASVHLATAQESIAPIPERSVAMAAATALYG